MGVRLFLPLLFVVVASVGAVLPPGIGIALLRADGTLQPLARLDREGWAGVPPREAAGEWRLWLFDDPAVRASPFTARAARPLVAGGADGGGGCIAVPVDPAWLSAPAPPSKARLGIALSGTDARPDLPTEIAIDSEAGRQVAANAAPAFHRAEDEALTLQRDELPAGFPTFAARRTRPIAWTRIVRQGVAQAPSRTYYLEGAKDYDGFRGRTDIGRIRTTGHVFLRVDGARETIDAEVDLSDVEGHQSVFRTPLAMFTWAGRAAWLFAVRGTDGTQLELMDVSPGPNRPRTVWHGPDDCREGE